MIKLIKNFSSVAKGPYLALAFPLYRFSEQKQTDQKVEDEQIDIEAIKNYQSPLTEFQKEFGFGKLIKEQGVISEKEENKVIRNLNLVYLGIGLMVFFNWMDFFDRHGTERAWREYFKYNVSIKLKMINILPNASHSRKIDAIRTYLKYMEKIPMKDPELLLKLVVEISDLVVIRLSVLENLIAQQKTNSKKIPQYKTDILEALEIVDNLINQLNEKKVNIDKSFMKDYRLLNNIMGKYYESDFIHDTRISDKQLANISSFLLLPDEISSQQFEGVYNLYTLVEKRPQVLQYISQDKIKNLLQESNIENLHKKLNPGKLGEKTYQNSFKNKFEENVAFSDFIDAYSMKQQVTMNYMLIKLLQKAQKTQS